MKTLAIILLVLACAIPAYATPHNTAGAKLQAPNLIRITDNWTVGAEAGKDLFYDKFYEKHINEEADRGYFVYLTVTYTGSLLNFAKK